MDKLQELRNCIAAVNKDSTKFFEGNNKAAGTRARKHLQELKSLAQELRVLIQSTKNEKQAEQHAEVEHEEHDPQQYAQPQLLPMDPHAAAAAHYGNYAHQPVDQEGGY
ncbi:hypothetical protein MMPV_002907 [Pyropia vietnamensis]